jgi:hypothetical protein
MPEPATLNLSVKQGSDKTIDIYFGVNDEPVNLAGYTYYAYARETKKPDAAIKFQFTCTNMTTFLRLTVAKAVTAALTVGYDKDQRASQFPWDLLQVSPTGVRDYPLEGEVTIAPRRTNLA